MIIPLKNFILIKKPEDETKTKSGIFIPTNKQDFSIPKGEIVRVGESANPNFKVGDIIVYNKGYENDIIDDQKDYILVKDEYVMAIIK
jgi:co-chaperonin GroES (HSP10)